MAEKQYKMNYSPENVAKIVHKGKSMIFSGSGYQPYNNSFKLSK